MYFISFSILLIQVAVYALPTTSLSIYNRGPEHSERKTEKVVIKGNEYTATPLPNWYQGEGELFRLEGGFQMDGALFPAILKRVYDHAFNDSESSRTQLEIDFIERGSTELFLHAEWTETKTGELPYQFHIVVRDLRNFDPPFKPFPEWYKEKEHISGTIALHTVTKDIQEQLMWYANNRGMIYDCYTMDSIFITEKLYNKQTQPTDDLWRANIVPVSWKPKIDQSDVFGVEDISNYSPELAASKIDKHIQQMDEELESEFSVDKLRKRLIALGGKLRERDTRHVEFQGKEYVLLQKRRVEEVYTVYDVFTLGKGGKAQRVPRTMMVIDERNKDDAAADDWDVFPENELIAQSSAGDDPFIRFYKD